jgi:hypothetical protein
LNRTLFPRLLAPSFAILFASPLAAAGQQAGNARSTVFCYTSYDTEYFYIAAVVKKPTLVGSQSAVFGRPKEDDSVAVYLQSDTANLGAKRSAKSVEMAASVAGGVQLYRGASAVPLTGYQDFLKTAGEAGRPGRPVPFKFGVKRSGTLNGPASATSGYSVEMAIPWVELGEAPAPGKRMRFNVVSYSADPQTSKILSLSPAVKNSQDVQNPSLWTEIVFVDAPVRSVPTAPDAKVCARLYTSKPLVDGELEEGPWFSLTAFGFGEAAGGGVETIAPNSGLSRVRPKVPLKAARPPIAPPSARGTIIDPKPHASQPLPRLVLTSYQFDFQNDSRKLAPFKPVKTTEGATRLTHHPLSGTGPWMTYDRVDWHLGQLVDVRKAGIDVILPVYSASAGDKQRHSVRGLMTLTAALKQMHAGGRDYPLVGLHLNTSTLADAKGGRPDLTSAAGKTTLYAAIKDFFLLVPPRFRAAVPLAGGNGGGDAYIVVLSSADAFSEMDASFTSYCRARFKRDFGADLLLLGHPDFKSKAPLDGYVQDTRGAGFHLDDSGWIKPASVGPGHHPLEATDLQKVRGRQEGESYRKDWKQALAKQPSWVFVDGWNDFADGAEIAPSLQHGVEYVDLTRVFAHLFRSGGTALRASYLSHNIPRVALASGSTNVVVRLTNAGAGIWPAETYALAYRWKKQDGGAVDTSTLVKLPASVISSQSITVPFALKLPSEPGAYSLVVDVAQVSKKGDITALLSGLGSQTLEVLVRIVGASDPGLAKYGVTVVSNDLTTTAETGGSYVARVTLRNDGSQTWKKGGAGRIVARVWRYTSLSRGVTGPEELRPVEMADAGVDVPVDVPPGGLASVTVPVTFSTADEEPLRSWSQADSWSYQLRWEFSADETGSSGAVSSPEPLALVDADFGVQFTSEVTPIQLPGERRQPVRIGLRNLGPQTWAQGAARVGYHWYYLDGTEAVWQDETTALPQAIEPGGVVTDMLAWVAAPPYDGTYWLVWDVKIGETWSSTLPSVRSGETLVRKVEVVGGRLNMVDLRPSYNLDGVAGDANRADGAFDTAGRSLPAELVPPYATMDEAPVGMWVPGSGSGLDSARKISFRWGPKADGAKNVIQCMGQKVPLGERKNAHPVSAVHLLAASTKARPIGAFTLVFEDGSEQLTSMPIDPWDAPQPGGEGSAYYCRYSRSKSGDDAQKPVALFHYVIKVSEKKKLVAIQMPNTPEIKIAGITLER